MSDFRAYFPRLFGDLSRLFPPAWASRKSFRAYFPRPFGPQMEIRRDFRAYFPRPLGTFALISPGLFAVSDLSRLFPPASDLIGDFRAYFPRPTGIFRPFALISPGWSSNPGKSDFRPYFPRPTARLLHLLVSSDYLIDEFS